MMAPGWDLTYSRESLFSPPYYHTSGLGSPFLEDVKLCAAASPDAARTFKRTTRTALPLTDTELGLAPASTLAKLSAGASKGWDGEYCPFVQVVEGRLMVNYPSIERSDYISNYANDGVSFADLRKIEKPEANSRMTVLSQVNKILLSGTAWDKSDYWLVSFVKVTAGDKPESFVNIPVEFWQKSKLDEQFLRVENDGYFFVFAQYKKCSFETATLKRRIQPVDVFTFVKASVNDAPEIITYHA